MCHVPYLLLSFFKGIDTGFSNVYGCTSPVYTKRFNETCNLSQFSIEEKRKFKHLWEDVTMRALGNCGIPCSIMDINFGYPIIDTTEEEYGYVKLYFKMAVNVQRSILAYSTLSFLAEVGGYIGLLLGFSLLDLSKLVHNFRPQTKKYGTGEVSVTPVEKF